MTVRSILVPCDFSDASRRALQWARLFRARLPAAITLLHVDVDPIADDHPQTDVAGYETPEEHERRTRWLESELRREAESAFGPDAQAVRLMVVRGRPGERIREIAKDLGVDLVIVGGSGKGAVDRFLLGSVTQALVRRSSVAVMTVH